MECYFSWNSGNNILELHDRTRDEAFGIAREFGWTPKSWYLPSTWNNYVIMS